MKTITIVLLTFLVSLQMVAGKVIKIKDIEYAPSWMTINEVELAKDATIIRVTLKPGSAILNNTVLADRNTGKEYKFLRVEGVKVQERPSKETSCSIYFETLDASVKEINYIEVGNNPLGNFYGIKLQHKAKVGKESKVFDPESLNYDYYMNQPFTPDTAWHFSNVPYKKAFETGRAQLKIHMSGTPKELASVLPNAKAIVENQITRHEEIYVSSIGEDFCYVLDLNLSHPQFVNINPVGSVFIAPGDTLEMFSTIESAPDGSGPRFKTFRGNSESVMINTLLPEFMKKYGREEYDYAEAQATIGKGKDATQTVLERWANQVNEIIADEELRQALIQSPISTFGKDLVMISILTNKCIEIEDVVSDYTYKANTYTQMEDGNWKKEPNPDYAALDLKAVYNTLMKNKELIYDNPLALCESNQWIFVNRTLYGPLFRSWEEYKDEDGVAHHRRCDKYAMAGTFMNDLYLSQEIVSRMETTIKDIKLGKLGESHHATLDFLSDAVGESLAGIQNVKVAQNIVEEYRKFVKATETTESEDTGNSWTEEQMTLWNKIVSTYKGYTLFLDFWAMSCGPCRSAMMDQRKLVEEMKDEKVKFLYITTDDQKSSAEKWMTENNIKGEHVYITQTEWEQFETMINFSAIPHGALVSKEGKLIEQDFQMYQFNSEELKKLAERF